MSLLTYLEAVPDPRRRQGQRFSLSQLLQIILVSNLCGHLGGRGICRFAKEWQEELTEILDLKYPIPSHVTISGLINGLDQDLMIEAFNKWAVGTVGLNDGEFVSSDGKALGSTVKNAKGQKQDFEAIVSLFVQKSGLIYSIEKYSNKKESEIPIIRMLIESFKAKNVTFFMDALHCQKKQLIKS